eukprot:12125352-Alexandrium_andersonii.AAC.1
MASRQHAEREVQACCRNCGKSVLPILGPCKGRRTPWSGLQHQCTQSFAVYTAWHLSMPRA